MDNLSLLTSKSQNKRKDFRLNSIKINKVFEVNLKSQVESNVINTSKNTEVTKKIDIKTIEKNKQKALKLIKKYILFRGNYLLKLKKYFNDWRLIAKNLELEDLSKIIQEFTRGNMEILSIKRGINNWKKLGKRIYYKPRIKLLKMRTNRTNNINLQKKKIYELIRITKLNRIFSLRRYLHYIILVWYIYAKNIHRKRVNMKFLYENLLRTYMSLAKDIFGNNQLENPSVQDAMYEAVNTNKFITMHQEDVPLARKHYEDMRRKKIIEMRKREELLSTTTKIEEEQKEVSKTYYSKEKEEEDKKMKSEEKRKQELLNKYRQYKSMNRELIWEKRNRYISSIEKDNNEEDNDDNKKKDNKINKTTTRINSEGNKNQKETSYTFNKTPKESKYLFNKIQNYTGNNSPSNYNNIKTQKNIEIREYKKVENKTYKENKDISPLNKSSTSSRNINISNYTKQSNSHISNSKDNSIKPNTSYSYQKIEINNYTKPQSQRETTNNITKYETTKTTGTKINNINSNVTVVSSSYKKETSNKNEIKPVYNYQNKYIKKEGNSMDKANESKYIKKVEITSGTNVDKDKEYGKKITTTKSFITTRTYK
jgi:hypothetical protein